MCSTYGLLMCCTYGLLMVYLCVIHMVYLCIKKLNLLDTLVYIASKRCLTQVVLWVLKMSQSTV